MEVFSHAVIAVACDVIRDIRVGIQHMWVYIHGLYSRRRSSSEIKLSKVMY